MASGTTYIKDPEIFKRLIQTIDIFVHKNNDNLEEIDRNIDEKERKIREIQDLLTQRLIDAENKHRNCEHELTLCRTRVEYDDDGNLKKPNCRSESNAVEKAYRQVKYAKEALKQMDSIIAEVEKVIRSYNSHKELFLQLLEKKLPESQGVLNDHDLIMQEYLKLRIN